MHTLFIPTLVDGVIISPIFIDSHLALTHRVISRHVIGGNCSTQSSRADVGARETGNRFSP